MEDSAFEQNSREWAEFQMVQTLETFDAGRSLYKEPEVDK